MSTIRGLHFIPPVLLLGALWQGSLEHAVPPVNTTETPTTQTERKNVVETVAPEPGLPEAVKSNTEISDSSPHAQESPQPEQEKTDIDLRPLQGYTASPSAGYDKSPSQGYNASPAAESAYGQQPGSPHDIRLNFDSSPAKRGPLEGTLTGTYQYGGQSAMDGSSTARSVTEQRQPPETPIKKYPQYKRTDADESEKMPPVSDAADATESTDSSVDASASNEAEDGGEESSDDSAFESLFLLMKRKDYARAARVLKHLESREKTMADPKKRALIKQMQGTLDALMED